MGSNRIKVAQRNNGKLRFGFGEIRQYLFHHNFGGTIRTGRPANRPGFDIGHRRIDAIHRGRRAKNKMMYTGPAHFFQQHQSAADVVLIILQRFMGRFPDRLQSSKMNDCGNLVIVKNAL